MPKQAGRQKRAIQTSIDCIPGFLVRLLGIHVGFFCKFFDLLRLLFMLIGLLSRFLRKIRHLKCFKMLANVSIISKAPASHFSLKAKAGIILHIPTALGNIELCSTICCI